MGIRRVTPAKLVEAVYRVGRRDSRRIPFEGETLATIRTDYPKPDAKQQAVQGPEDQHGPGYDGEVAKDWRRGYGKHPHFDAGPSGKRHQK